MVMFEQSGKLCILLNIIIGQNMNIIIIGATSGIGKALFKKYVTEGNLLGIVGRRTNLLEELRQQHPDSTFTTTADITKQIEIESLR